MPEKLVKMMEIQLTNFQKEGKIGLGYILFGLGEDGIVYRYDNTRNGWIANSSRILER